MVIARSSASAPDGAMATERNTMNATLTANAAPVTTGYRSSFERSPAVLCTAAAEIANSIGQADADMGKGRAAARQHYRDCVMGLDVREAPPVSADGRVARRQRNRERVVDAYVRLLREGVAEPNAVELATIADVTPRTVYRYMREDATLKADVADRIVSTLRLPFSLDESVPLGLRDRIDVFVSYRLDAYEQSGAIMHIVRSHLSQGPVAMIAIEAGLAVLREQLIICFAPELQHLVAADRLAMVASLQTLVLFDSLECLFEHLGQQRCVIHELLCRNLHAVVSVAAITSDPVRSG